MWPFLALGAALVGVAAWVGSRMSKKATGGGAAAPGQPGMPPPVVTNVAMGKSYALDVLVTEGLDPVLLSNLIATGSTTPVASAIKRFTINKLPDKVKTGVLLPGAPGKNFDEWIVMASPLASGTLPLAIGKVGEVVFGVIRSAIEMSPAAPAVAGHVGHHR